MESSRDRQQLLALTAEIVASFVGSHTAATGDLPGLIKSVFGSLRSAGQAEATKAPDTLTPAVPIKRSVGTDFFVCLEDGK
jgi:predicted transcriptional regulator